MPNSHPGYPKSSKNRARSLRRLSSESEKKLWRDIRNDALGVRFRRQFPVGNYFLDFYAPTIKLAVEVDGELHDATRDSKRDAYLADQEIYVIRIPSHELFNDKLRRAHLDSLWEEIHRRIDET
jgi:very-short-patch-repair endonuclease